MTEAREAALVMALKREHGRGHSISDYAFSQHNRCYCEEHAKEGMPHGCHSCTVLDATSPAAAALLAQGERVRAALEEQGSERGDGLWHILGCPARLFHPKKCAPRCQMARAALGEGEG